MSRVLICLSIAGALALVVSLSLLVLQIKNVGIGTEDEPDLNKELLSIPVCENNDTTNLWKIATSPPTFIFGSFASSNFEDLIEFVSSNTKAAFLSSDEILFTSTTEQRKSNSGKARQQMKGNQIKDIISSDLYGRLVGKIFEFSQDDLYARALLMTMKQVTPTEFMIFFNNLVEQITEKNMTKFDWDKLEKPRTLQLGLETWALDLNKTVLPLTESRKYVLPEKFLEFMLNEALDRLEPDYTDTQTAIEAVTIQKYKCAEFNSTNLIFNLLFRFDASEERMETAEALNMWWTEDNNVMNKVFAEKIKTMLMSDDRKRKFIVVDIKHLAGPYGTIIHLLEEEGFKIQRVKTSEPLSKLLF